MCADIEAFSLSVHIDKTARHTYFLNNDGWSLQQQLFCVHYVWSVVRNTEMEKKSSPRWKRRFALYAQKRENIEKERRAEGRECEIPQLAGREIWHPVRQKLC